MCLAKEYSRKVPFLLRQQYQTTSIEIKLCRQLNKFTVGCDLMHDMIHKTILCFTTYLTYIDLCWGMNFDMVG